MNIKGVRANLWSQGMKVLFSPLRVRKSYGDLKQHIILILTTIKVSITTMI